MRYHSTRNSKLSQSAAQVILQGLAPDGGLFVPDEIPKLDYHTLQGKDYCGIGAAVTGCYLTDFSSDFLLDAFQKAYSSARFKNRVYELSPLKNNRYSLELWHGPTCAFKDFALMIMPRLLQEAKRILKEDSETLVLVATSGDTGKAALTGYQDLAGMRIAVFYPSGGTSEIQRLQMATQTGENVQVYAVEGNFDDAQTAVKSVFCSREIEEDLALCGKKLTSANSINWGRLVPQISYYFAAYLALLERGVISDGQPVDFCVPTGNFGDIMAGYYAKAMGLPVGRLVCASNENHVLPDFFATGLYNANRPFYKTASPSMDILISSNLERLLHTVLKSDTETAALYASLARDRQFRVSEKTMEELGRTFLAGYATDAQALNEIAKIYREENYLCDPHTAVAFRVAEDVLKSGEGAPPCVVLSTASPYKFSTQVLEALGGPVPQNEFDALRALEEKTGQPAPSQLSSLENAEVRFKTVISPQGVSQVVKKL